MQLNQIPRTMVHVTRRWARLPLTMTEAVTGHRGDEEWPPAIGFEAVAGRATEAIGRTLRDQRLVDEGQSMSEHAAHLREAVELEQIAKRRQNEAEQELEGKRSEANQRRKAAERSARERVDAAHRDRQERERQAEQEAERREQQAEEREREEQTELERAERTARKAAIGSEREAAEKGSHAVRAEAQVVDLDKEITRSKAARSARR